MLRTIRIIIATVLFALITMLFLDFTGTLHTWFGWLAKIQFLPAALAFSSAMTVAYPNFDKQAIVQGVTNAILIVRKVSISRRNYRK